jgi:steroid 5-alpha reductase family enzyme
MEILFENIVFLSYVVLAYMSFWFLVAILFKRNDVADIAWGLGFLLLAIVSFYRGGIDFDRGFLVTFLIALWAFRLSLHIYFRNKGKKEDYRYEKWRKDWGNLFYLRSYLQVFILQGFFMLIISSSFIIVNTYRGGIFTWLDILGIVVFLFGFYFETVGDLQLSRFIEKKKLNKKMKGKVLQEGLWKYSRHPNYFGEVTQWWGIWIIALNVSYGVFGIISPLLITTLILFVSGIPLLEKNKEGEPEFEKYKKRVSMFFPLPPKKLN